jgi:hypothetical protein
MAEIGNEKPFSCRIQALQSWTDLLQEDRSFRLGGTKFENDGRSSSNDYRISDPRKRNSPYMVQNPHNQSYNKGLSGRYIALWQSHGRYYEAKTERWEWQRAPLFRTVEDMYTQSYVLPFLMPMLENAGAYVMTPRKGTLKCTKLSWIMIHHLPINGQA